jgi:hypothetical protein
MDGNRRWFGWIAIGLGALALLIALGGRGFGPQGSAAALSRANAPQAYAQQGAGPQGVGPQRGADARGPDAQGGAGRPEDRSQRGVPGPDARRGAGRPGDGGFGLGGWFRSPFRLLGGLPQIGMLALLVVLGLWLIRGRSAGGAAGSGPAKPAQQASPEPPSPTGESYSDEPDNHE